MKASSGTQQTLWLHDGQTTAILETLMHAARAAAKRLLIALDVRDGIIGAFR